MASKGQLQSPTKVTPPAPPIKPGNPKMGTCEETYKGSGTYYYVFGGKPKADWSGIEDLKDRSMSDLCFRSLDPVVGQKSAHYRTKALTNKFEVKNSISDFQADVWDHLFKYGLDTIAYLPDPKNNTEVLNVVSQHAQFTGDMSHVVTTGKTIAKNFDIWDKKNDAEAKTFLLASLAEDLKKDFKPFHDKEKDTFSVTWLKLIHYLVSSNSRTFDKLKDEIRKIRPQQYGGQNIEKMSADYILKAEELINAGYFDSSLILNMVDGFLCATRDAKGTFHHTLNDLRRKVDKLQQSTIFMSKKDQMDQYSRERLSYKDVCFSAVKEYKTLCDDNMWEPKKLPRDRQAPAAQSINLTAISQALNLIANMPSHGEGQSKISSDKRSNDMRNKGGTKCYNCGKAGHIAKDCPEPVKNTNERQAIRHKRMPDWQLKPPTGNENHSKTVNGKTYYWCDKCKNWTPTHTSQQHGTQQGGNRRKNPKHKQNKKKGKTIPAETNLAAFEPSAWIVSIENEQSPFSLMNFLKYTYFVLTIAILLGLPVPWYVNILELKQHRENIWEVIMTATLSISTTIGKYIDLFKMVTGPISWVCLGYIICKIPLWFQKPFDPIQHQPLPRAVRRCSRSRSRSRSTPRLKLKSARDHNLHPKYPIRLRTQNQYNTRSTTPTAHQRFVQSRLDSWVQRCAPPHYSSSSQASSTTQPETPSPLLRRGRPIYSPPTTSRSTKSKGGNVNQRKYSHESRQIRGSKTKTPCRCTVKHHMNSFCPTVMPSKPKPCYVPTGIKTRRDTPNLNMTSKQHRRVKNLAHSVLLTRANIDNTIRDIARSVSMLAPAGFRAVVSSTKESLNFPIIWDSGASICVSPDRNDFIKYNTSVDITEVKGVGTKNSTVVGQGTVEWSIHDVNGSLRKFKLKAYHIPTCKARLISTSSLLKAYQGEYITIDENSLKLSGINGNPHRSQVVAFNNPVTHLPTTNGYNSRDASIPNNALYNVVSTVSQDNHNLSEAQKELLRWHQRLGHLDFNKIKHLLRTGVLSNAERSRHLQTAASKIEHNPKCAACLFGKQTITSAPGKTVKVIRDRAGILRAGNLLPGQEVSVDHFISSVRGRLFKGYNRGSIEDRYIGGCIFVDHASSYIHVEFQSSLSSHETLAAKLEYERLCRDVGVIPQKYMSDNGTSFTSKAFTEHLKTFFQTSKFAGVGAHHHNAQAERAIRTIMSIARTMMIHSGIHWPDVADSTLWPMAVKHACFLFNHVPNHTTGLSPADLFTKVRWPQRKFLDMHVWGCPVYVLEKSLQDGKKIPRWRPRSNRSMYMGISDKHASTVPTVLNLSTGAITPQFHVVFDDYFATVGSDHKDLPDFSSEEWSKMFGDSTYQYIIEESTEDDGEINDLKDALKNEFRTDEIIRAQEEANEPQPLNVEEPVHTKMKNKNEAVDTLPPDRNSNNQRSEGPTIPPQEDKASTPSASESVKEEQETQRKQASPRKNPVQRRRGIERLDLGPRVSRRTRESVKRLTYTHDKESLIKDIGLASLAEDELSDSNAHVYSVTPDYYVLVSSSKENNPDIFSYDEAMSSEHRLEWIQAAIKEIEALEKLNCWIEIPLEQATTKVLPGTWVFKVKRAPDGSFKKFKARYCIRGDLQEGDFETYAPVVQFSSVRLFLAWSLMLGWYTCSIDFSNAFIQATLTDPTFIHLPRGFRSSSNRRTCLKLKKSLYGLSVAPRLWYQHLRKGLQELGLKESKHDPCLLLRKDLIVICYVDDLGIQAPNKEIVDELIVELRKRGFDLTLEGSFSEYLGIKYTKVSDTEIKMTQEGLIKKILDATGMNECNSNKTPATREALGSDEQGEPMEDSWNYRSIIGMLLYLSTNTRPDIAYAVSQVARFSHNPKKSHASAVKTIIRYLSGSMDQGVIYKRPDKLQVDCFVDADFAGLYGREPPENPVSVKSRTGYIISVGGCYILCKSQLQSMIALSTSEAEYGALSQAMRAIIPIRETLLEMIKAVDMVNSENQYPFGRRSELCSFPTFVHEDNTAALSLAVNQKVTSRTKHWCVKFHFFWSYVNDKQNNTQCIKVDTKEQRADYLTKGLPRDAFENCRFLNQGW